jgi:hypothetical protein
MCGSLDVSQPCGPPRPVAGIVEPSPITPLCSVRVIHERVGRGRKLSQHTLSYCPNIFTEDWWIHRRLLKHVSTAAVFSAERYERIVAFCEIGGVRDKSVVAYFKVLPRHSPGGMEENRRILQGGRARNFSEQETGVLTTVTWFSVGLISYLVLCVMFQLRSNTGKYTEMQSPWWSGM